MSCYVFPFPYGFQYLIGYLQVSFSSLRIDQSSNTAEGMQGGFFHSYTPEMLQRGLLPQNGARPIRVAEDSLNNL